MKLRISLHGTRGGDRERLLIRRKKAGITGFLCDLFRHVSPLNIYTKLWHCIVPEKPDFLKTRKAEGSREKTHIYICITVSLFNVSLVLFKLFNITVLFAYIQQD